MTTTRPFVGLAASGDESETDRQTSGQHVADWLTSRIGSWRFIHVQSALLAGRIVVNTVAWIARSDRGAFPGN
jgi:uncharacterized membrane protein